MPEELKLIKMISTVALSFTVLLAGCGGPREPSAFQKHVIAAKEAGVPLVITGRSVDVNSAGGADVELNYRNISGKTIKYIQFTVKLYNGVGDAVRGSYSRSSTSILKETGPFKTDTSDGGTWSAILYNYSTKCVRITKVRITYMNDKVKNYTGSGLAKLFGPRTGNSCKV
jgi:hypothetical protein